MRTAAFSADGTRIVTVFEWRVNSWAKNLLYFVGEAHIWDTATGKEIAVLPAPADKKDNVGSPGSDTVVPAPKGYQSFSNVDIASAAFSPDGKQLVTVGSESFARIWDVATAKLIAVLSGHKDSVNFAAFSIDGARIVTASSDKTACIWNAATANQIAVTSGHEGAVNSAVFSPDGTRVVTASGDKTARIWDAVTAVEIAVLSGHDDSVRSAVFSSDGKRIVTASQDETARESGMLRPRGRSRCCRGTRQG